MKNKEINEAKKILAFEVTKLSRGNSQANEANDISNNIFDKNKLDDRINSLKINSTRIIDSSFTIMDAIQKLNLIESRSEIKRLIKSDGIKINNLIYKENDFSLTKYINEKEIKISVGKKKIGILKITK